MDLAHEERYAGHPILRLFTRPEEMENGTYMQLSKEDIAHMNSASGKKLTQDTLNVAMTLHERHSFHLAVATDGAKKGGTKDRGETQRLSDTTYGVWQGPESVDILKNKMKEATALQKRLGVKLDERDKLLAIEQGVLSGKLGDSATAAEAELFAIFAIMRRIQAQQYMGKYGNEKARILIMSDCLAGLRVIEKVWRGKRNEYRKLRNGAVLEAITNVRETLGLVVFMWTPSHVGIIPNVIADNIAIRAQGESPEGMVTGLISKQVKSRPIIYKRKVGGQAELADNPIYQEARRRGKKVIRDMHRPPEGGDTCESGVARGMIEGCGVEEKETSDFEIDIERQEGKREVEKFVHGLRNGEIVGGPAEERRMRHATREGNRPSSVSYTHLTLPTILLV
eukprot:1041842-Pleurochrysis_carterae.AAC.1